MPGFNATLALYKEVLHRYLLTMLISAVQSLITAIRASLFFSRFTRLIQWAACGVFWERVVAAAVALAEVAEEDAVAAAAVRAGVITVACVGTL